MMYPMTDQHEVPDALRRLWRLEEQTRMGRPAVLDVEQVVTAAVGLADADGLGGVTLPKIAKTLGVTSMSLYRYVGSKDELLTLMADAAIGPPPDIESLAWRSALGVWLRAQLFVHQQRPWLVRVPVSGPPSGPGQLAWMDCGLRAMRETGLSWKAKIGVLTVLGGHVRQSALLNQELAEGRGEGVDQATAERDYGRALFRLVTPERFPEAAQLFASQVFESTSDDDFEVGLELILDGIAFAVREINGPPAGDGPG
jgi:AcrR family transcriptional regulator